MKGNLNKIFSCKVYNEYVIVCAGVCLRRQVYSQGPGLPHTYHCHCASQVSHFYLSPFFSKVLSLKCNIIHVSVIFPLNTQKLIGGGFFYVEKFPPSFIEQPHCSFCRAASHLVSVVCASEQRLTMTEKTWVVSVMVMNFQCQLYVGVSSISP